MRIEMITGGTSITMNIIMPEKWHKYKMENAKVLWMLHDKFDTSSDWISFTQAEIFAEEHEIVLVCPTMNSARYNDWINGCRWQTYFTEELYEYVHEMLPLSKKPEDNILFGFGRGGFGALKYLLTCPDKYGCAYSVSYDDGFVQNHIKNSKAPAKFFNGYASPEEVEKSPENISWLAEYYKKNNESLPVIYLAYAKDSDMYERNLEIKELLINLGYDINCDEADGNSSWNFCNTQLEKALNLID